MKNYQYLLLDDHSTRPCSDKEAAEQWGRWAKDFSSKIVAKTELDDCQISTVFLGIDHSFGDGPPILFETMIFGGEHDQWCERYETWDQAAEHHRRIVEALKAGEELPE